MSEGRSLVPNFVREDVRSASCLRRTSFRVEVLIDDECLGLAKTADRAPVKCSRMLTLSICLTELLCIAEPASVACAHGEQGLKSTQARDVYALLSEVSHS